MRFRAWYGVSLALLVLGIAGVAFGYPLSPSSDPVLVDTRFAPSGPLIGGVLVDRPGQHTVWHAGAVRSDRTGCRITGPDGATVALTAPRVTVRWEPGWSDAVDEYAELGTFDAPAAGEYGIECTVDPDAPGTSIVVTRKPALGRAMATAIGGAVALLAAVAIAVTVFVRQRRRTAV